MSFIGKLGSTTGGGGGGASAFTDLTDAPASYTSQSGKYIRVKATEDGLEFATVSAAGDFITLTDTPSSYTSQAGKLLSVKGTEDGVEFIATSTLSITESQISDLGSYLTSETDPIFTASDAAGITAADIANWDTAFSWGNHASAGYLTSLTGAVLTDQTVGQTIGATGARLTKLWATDITCTNAIAASITGSAPTLTTARAIYGNNFDGSAALTQIIASTYGGTGNGFTKFSGPTTAEKTFTLPDSNATLLYDGGALGTPASGTLTNCTFPTLNQNTTGSAAKWTTARNLAGNSVDGSANVAFANKFIVQGTADTGLSAAQFLGALGTGIVKNTTTTGVLSIATGQADFTGLTSSDSPTFTDLTLTGGDLICSTATTFNLINTVATTVNTFGAATTITSAANASNTNWTFGNSTGGTKTFIFDVGSTKQGSLLFKHQGTSKFALYSTDPTDSLRIYSYTNAADLFTFAPTVVTSAVPISATTGFRIGGAATSGKILRGNGTNYVASTATYPDTITANQVLYATSSNVVGSGTGLTFDGTQLTNTTTTINTGMVGGNAKIGPWAGGNTYAAFAHSTVSGTSGSYAVLQSNAGVTYLNAASGQTLNLRINNSDVASVDTNRLYMVSGKGFPWTKDWTPRTAKLPTAVTAATLDGGSARDMALFDASTAEYLDLPVGVIPFTYNTNQTWTVKILWSAASATSGNCIWAAQFMAVTAADALDIDTDSFDTAQTVTTAAAATAGYLQTSSITLTNRDSAAAGDFGVLRIYRDAANGSDTMTGDAELRAVILEAN